MGAAPLSMVSVASKATPMGWKIRDRRAALRRPKGTAVASRANIPSGGRAGWVSWDASLTSAVGCLFDQAAGDDLEGQRLVGPLEDRQDARVHEVPRHG